MISIIFSISIDIRQSIIIISLIRYQLFIDTIDGQTQQGVSATQSKFDPVTQDQTTQLLDYYRQIISIDRLHLKEPFKDFDRSKCSHIKKSQFKRVLDLLKFLPPNQKLFNALCNRYCDNGCPNQVNYVKFLKDIDDVNQILKTLVIGIKTGQSNFKPSQTVSNPKDLKMMKSLYTRKELAKMPLNIQQLLQKIKAQVVMKRIRIRQFFIDFDTLRKNLVTKDQFKRIVSNYNVTITPQQYEQLCQTFRNNQTDNRIKWMDFCDQVDKVWTIKQLQKDPLLRVDPYRQQKTLPARRDPIKLSPQQQQKFNKLTQIYRTQIKNKRVLIKGHFQNFDITKQGYITKNQFLRILDMFRIKADDQSLDILLKYYADKGNLNQINYYQFCRDVDIYNQDSKIIAKTHADSFANWKSTQTKADPTILNYKPNNLQDLLSRLRKKICQERIRVSQFLRDFDKLRTGTVPNDLLRQGLNMAKIPLSQDQFKLITNHFQVENKPGFSRWKDICNLIEQKEQNRFLQTKNPSKPLQTMSQNYYYGKVPISQQQINLAQNICDRFRQFSRLNRLDLKEAFKSWDKLGRYKVTPKQFRQVLATFNFQLNQKQFEAISKAYASDNQKEVCYVKFCNDTNPFQQMIGSQIPFNYSQGGFKKPVPGLEQVLIQIKKKSKINRLRYRQFFIDFDPLRHGVIKKNKFSSVLTQIMNLSLQEETLKWIQKYYQDPTDSTRLLYEKFLNDIDIVFTKYQLQKDPLTKPPNYDYSRTQSRKIQQQADFESLMQRLGQVTYKRRLLLKPFFQDKDKAKSGKISFIRMRSILDYNKIPLSQQQYNLLCKRFSYQGIQFNYAQFIQLLKTYEKDPI